MLRSCLKCPGKECLQVIFPTAHVLSACYKCQTSVPYSANDDHTSSTLLPASCWLPARPSHTCLITVQTVFTDRISVAQEPGPMAAAAASPSGERDAADPSCPASTVHATLQVIQAPARAFLPIKKERQALPPFMVQVLFLTPPVPRVSLSCACCSAGARRVYVGERC